MIWAIGFLGLLHGCVAVEWVQQPRILKASQTRLFTKQKSVWISGSFHHRALAPPSSEEITSCAGRTILCSYRNSTNQMVIVRARGDLTFFLERVVFPFEIMTFHCPRECEVEVVRRTPTGLEESEWVLAEELQAGDGASLAYDDWRPARIARSVNVRSSASTICRDRL